MLKHSFPGQSLELTEWATWAAGMGEVWLLLFPGTVRLHGNPELAQERVPLTDDGLVPFVSLSFP